MSQIVGTKSDDEATAAEDGNEDVDLAAGGRRARTLAGYADLLKMHAYRDAIYRSAGAYVLYPGKVSVDPEQRYRRHAVQGRADAQDTEDLLPGLGAFAVRPAHGDIGDSSRSERTGIMEVRAFLERTCRHVANTVAPRARASRHLGQVYAPFLDTPTPLTLRHVLEEMRILTFAGVNADVNVVRSSASAMVRLAGDALTIMAPSTHVVFVHGSEIEQALWRVTRAALVDGTTEITVTRVAFAAASDAERWKRGIAGARESPWPGQDPRAVVRCGTRPLESFLREVAHTPTYGPSSA